MALTMEKRVEKVKLVMEKRGAAPSIKAQIKFELDVSGSTEDLYKRGHMQELTERLMAVALRLDADGKLEVYSFGSKAYKHGDVTEDQISGYIAHDFQQQSRAGGTWMTGTNYAAAVFAAVAPDADEPAPPPKEEKKSFFGNLFGSKKEPKQEQPQQQQVTPPDYPSFHLFVTDGDDRGDRGHFKDLLAAHPEQYFMMIGVGNPSDFGLLKEVADRHDHVGFCHFSDLSVSDDTMYDQILSKEAVDWLIKHQPKA